MFKRNTRGIIGFLFSTMMLLGSYTSASAGGITTISITQNGENTYYQLNDIRKLTFDAENMFLTLTDNEVVTFPFSSLTTIGFGDVTGIATLKDGLHGRRVCGWRRGVEQGREPATRQNRGCQHHRV